MKIDYELVLNLKTAKALGLTGWLEIEEAAYVRQIAANVAKLPEQLRKS